MQPTLWANVALRTDFTFYYLSLNKQRCAVASNQRLSFTWT